MNFIKQYGSQVWAPLLIRVPLGGYLFFLGLWAMRERELFSSYIAYMSGISGTLINFYSAIGPYVFVLCGFCIVLGFLTSAVALLSFVVIFSLYLGANIFHVEDMTVDYFGEKRQLYKDIALLCAILSLLFSGPGGLSLDSIMKKIYGEKRIIDSG